MPGTPSGLFTNMPQDKIVTVETISGQTLRFVIDRPEAIQTQLKVMNPEAFFQRKQLYFKVQEQLSEDLPYVDLWYLKMVAVYSKRLKNVNIPQSGNYDFLRTVELQQ